jgi:intergrase/recombinase
LARNCCERTVKDRLRYAKKFCYCLLKKDFGELNMFSDSKRTHILKALSNLAKFLGMYEDFKMLVRNYGLKWSDGKAEDLILSRIANTERNRDVIEWVRTVKLQIPKLSVFMDFIIVSGLRLEEAVRSYNLIIDLAKEGKLREYYDFETETLQHFRFKRFFIRRTKKAFISFIPKRLIEKIGKQEKLTRFQIDNWIRRDNQLKSRFSDIREYWATYMTKWLTRPEIDFLQGRVSANVFMQHYFNPALISDLKERVFNAVREIQAIS